MTVKGAGTAVEVLTKQQITNDKCLVVPQHCADFCSPKFENNKAIYF